MGGVMGWRERAIEKMEQAAGEWGVPFSAPDREDMAAAMLDALLAPESIPCPCVGFDRHGQEFAKIDCPTCHGEGSVPGEPLLIARDRLERPESLYETFRADDGLLSLRGRSDLWELRDVNEGEGQ